MDLVDVCTATSAGDNKRVVNKKNRDWRKRLRLRKTAVQPSTMQSKDKHGPKKIAQKWEQNAAWTSSKRSPQKAQQSQHRTKNRGNILRFKCSQCKDNLEYVPKDLVRHFKETHKGCTPVFPCQVCAFSTHAFSYLQVHLLSHENTFSTCSICNDNVQRTCSEFSSHMTMNHSQNGKYTCATCEKFSTTDARTFLEHMCLHDVSLERGREIDQKFQKQYCGNEAPSKQLMTNNTNVGPDGQNANENMKEVDPLTIKPNDSIPKMKHRLTRNAGREMCWLSKDCLSLPGREFLDKYCSLSDPKSTLEETQQFLMRSATGEAGDQKWTKALKTVLSNVPQDMNLLPKSENGIMSNSGFPNSSKDLTVLTVKNKITVPQNGNNYAKRFKMVAPSDKEETASAAVDAYCVFDPNRSQSDLNDQTPCPQIEMTLNDGASPSAQNEPAECTQIQENRENQELKIDQDIEEPKNANPIEDASKEPKLTNESDDQTPVHKALPKSKGKKRKLRRRIRSKTAKKGALGLKIVLKKNPVKDAQWVSRSPSSLSCVLLDNHQLPNPHTSLEEAQQFLQRAVPTENDQIKWTSAPQADQCTLSTAVTSTSESQLTSGEDHQPQLSACSDLGTHMAENNLSFSPDCTKKPIGLKTMDEKTPQVLKTMPSADQEVHDETEQPVQPTETEADGSSPASKTGPSDLENPSVPRAERNSENVLLQNSDSVMDCHVPDSEGGSITDGMACLRNYAESSPVSQPVIAPQGETPPEDSSLAVSLEQGVQGKRERELPTHPCPDPLSNTTTPSSQNIQEGPSPASVHQWQPAPRNIERTLKIIALSPSQLVKRPLGNQPVVVLNHPDADIPEVIKIMEVIHRYKGEVQKVILSSKTLKALSAIDGEIPGANDPADAQTTSPRQNSVQERFILKLKLRRMSRKKYQVVGAVSPSRDLPVKFRCWFCGRVFATQEAWMVHRQRHLMEWKSPNCENS
ncbi:uncharacterized protein znf518a [Myripristis murdjan]|uniref:Uncharacterized LOC115372390 n=1 Tax=Myripristis murdjan TaxID=586833 RepID=A0A667ZS78_9TELE|nr:uncharacterized protein LOC115372390 [Myripristis murdjan]XP_029926101.1 uncharacterized protein LOC115372390 [Myripristis murdjan]